MLALVVQSSKNFFHCQMSAEKISSAPISPAVLTEHQFSGWFIPEGYRWKIQNTDFHQEVMLISPEKHLEFLEQETSSGECSFV